LDDLVNAKKIMEICNGKWTFTGSDAYFSDDKLSSDIDICIGVPMDDPYAILEPLLKAFQETDLIRMDDGEGYEAPWDWGGLTYARYATDPEKAERKPLDIFIVDMESYDAILYATSELRTLANTELFECMKDKPSRYHIFKAIAGYYYRKNQPKEK